MNPYRLFFPLGLIFGVLGTVLWILLSLGWITGYPGQLHADFMIGGFLFSFASGFLMTAVPRFTGSGGARGWEIAVNAYFMLGLFALGMAAKPAAFHTVSLASMVFLIVFSARRFRSRTYDPPAFFVFVGVGLLSGTLGAVLLTLSEFSSVGPGAYSVGRILYYQGMILSLVIGVGGQLLPALFGWKDFSRVQITAFQNGVARPRLASPFVLGTLALFLISSFVIEGLWNPSAGRILRALVVTAVAFGSWKLHRRPAIRGNLPFWLWLSAWSLLAGSWIPALFPAYAVHGLHLAFVGGFGLMTLMIASRVTLAHGGYGTELEKNSKAIAVAGGLILLAALTRASAFVAPKSYLHHLAYASVTWILALVIWSGVFVPRMLKGEDADEETC